MAKRHYTSIKSLKKNEHYAGESARRTQEMEDGGMLHEDRSAIANMPQNIIMRPYPDNGMYMPEELDDTIRGVDAQINMDDRKRREHNVPKKV